jgi:predicted  nucleic acid-binding Zn-ribbon protein
LQKNGVSSTPELHAKVTAMQTQYYTLRGEIAAIGRQTDRLDEKLSMWKPYSENKVFQQRLAALKPRARETYRNRT